MTETPIPVQTPPKWLEQAEDAAQYLDVRPLLAAGEDPLSKVIELSATVAPNEIMVIEAPFNPAPLRNVLASQGFSSWGRKISDAHWRISFRRDNLGTSGDDVAGEGGVAGEGTSWYENGELHIDVRGLTPPLPMMLILRLLKRAKDDAVVIVHHERNPIYLVPEIAELGWQLEEIPGDPGEIRFKITRMEG